MGNLMEEQGSEKRKRIEETCEKRKMYVDFFLYIERKTYL